MPNYNATGSKPKGLTDRDKTMRVRKEDKPYVSDFRDLLDDSEIRDAALEALEQLKQLKQEAKQSHN